MALVLAVLLRIGIRLTTSDLADPELWEFEQIAKNLLEHETFAFRHPDVPSAFMPPAYPVLLYLLYAALGTGLAAHVVLAILLWIAELAIPFLVGAVADRIWGARVGFVALSTALFWPMLLATSGRVHDTPIYTALLIGAVALLFGPMGSIWKRSAALGALMGVFWTFRFEAPLFLLPMAVYLVFDAARRARPPISHLPGRAAVAALLGVCFLIPLSPWLIRNTVHFGVPLFSTEGGYALWRGHHEGATGTGRDPWPANRGTPIRRPPPEVLSHVGEPRDELVRDAWYREEALRFMRENPGREVWLSLQKIYYFLVADFTHPQARLWPIWAPSLAALVLGFIHWLRTGLRDSRQWTLWAIFGLQIALVVILFVLPRFRIMVDFVPLVFASAWVVQGPFGGWLQRRVFAAEPEDGSRASGLPAPAASSGA